MVGDIAVVLTLGGAAGECVAGADTELREDAEVDTGVDGAPGVVYMAPIVVAIGGVHLGIAAIGNIELSLLSI